MLLYIVSIVIVVYTSLYYALSTQVLFSVVSDINLVQENQGHVDEEKIKQLR